MNGWLVVTVVVAAAAAVVVPLLNQPVERPSPANARDRQMAAPARTEVEPWPRAARVALGCLVGVLSLGLLYLAMVSPFGQDPCLGGSSSDSEAFFCANSHAVNIVVTLGVIAGFFLPLALSVAASFTAEKSQLRRDWIAYCAAFQVCAGFAMLVMINRVS